MTDLTAARVLTIRQPWATLIALSVKRIETRPMSTSYRGPVLIHAGAHKPTTGPIGDFYCEPSYPDVRHVNDCYCDDGEVDAPCARRSRAEWALTVDGRIAEPLPLGAVVAVANLTDSLPIVHADFWADGLRMADRLLENHIGANGDFASMCTDDDHDITDQLPYGDFTPGRHGWLLADIQPLTAPIPHKGALGLRHAPAELLNAVNQQIGGDRG